MNLNLSAALTYLTKYHFSIIPCKTDKKPLIPWEEFQKRLPTEEEVKGWWIKYPEAQVGIITGIISGLCVIDLDNSEAEKTFNELVPDSILIPTVTTPRGGKHCYFKCTDPALNNKAMMLGKKMDFRANGGYVLAPPSTNGKGNQYAFLKELHIKDIALPILPSLDSIIKDNSFSLYKETKDKCPQVSGNVHKCLVEGRRDDDLFHIANSLIRSRTPIEDVTQVLEILAKNCNPPFPENEIVAKIQSALARADRRERNLTQEIKEWVMSTSGGFLSTDVHQCLVLSVRQDKKMVSEVLRRLCDDKIIEKFGNKNGQFRKIETDIDYINWYDADETSHLPIIYPLDLHDYALTLPKNIVIVAGSKDAGKTAFLLNIAALNRDKFKIHYFTSEMGEVELKKRNINISKRLNIPLKELRDKINWINRAENFPDLIFPEAVNIIDFLEITKDFYEVSDMIKKIYHKLSTGIAIIAIQKPSSRDMPIGGEKGLEKARIAIAIDNGKAKILVGKNWATETNPKDLECRFHILDGSEIRMAEMWDKKEQKEGRF